MAAEYSFEDAEAILHPQLGTVGAYLATPTPPALHKRIAGGLLCLGLAAMVLAGASIYANDNDLFQALSIVWEFAVYEIVAGFVLVGVCVAIHVYSRIHNLPKQDTAIAVKKAALRALTKCPRSGISMSTPMQTVRIRSFHIPCAHGNAVDCWMPSLKFMQQDFMQLKPSDFGAVDFDVTHKGHLCVYFDHITAEQHREKQYQKGRGRHA